jgi:hypothetical protein
VQKTGRKQLIIAGVVTEVCVAFELHRDWRNDIEGLGALFSNYIPNYRNLITSYHAKKIGMPNTYKAS